MAKCKITVIKKMFNQDLALEYCVSPEEVPACEHFTEGQEFIVGLEKPENFCDWAWDDINKVVKTLLSGGVFSQGIFEGAMKDRNTMVVCCSDAIRPVVFKVERLAD